jgi:hypothetical protein
MRDNEINPASFIIIGPFNVFDVFCIITKLFPIIPLILLSQILEQRKGIILLINRLIK